MKPVGSRAVPRKPWEKNVDAAVSAVPNLPRALDTDFPAVDDDDESKKRDETTTSTT